MKNMQQYLEAISRLEEKYEDISGDNVTLAGVRLLLYSDGSGSLIFEWNDDTINRPIETSKDLLKAIYGAGETEIEFKNILELDKILRDRKVFDEQ